MDINLVYECDRLSKSNNDLNLFCLLTVDSFMYNYCVDFAVFLCILLFFLFLDSIYLSLLKSS